MESLCNFHNQKESTVNQTSPLLLLCGLYCVPMLLVLMLGVFIGRFKPRLRSPIALDNGGGDRLVKAGTPAAVSELRRAARKDNAGYGG